VARTPAKKAGKATVGKRVIFDRETWNALDLMGRDRMMTLQELADEAFRDLLKKHGRPTDLRSALKQSARAIAANQNKKTPARGGGK
jgi:predicted DNA-binding ribbon-helix-helix protein